MTNRTHHWPEGHWSWPIKVTHKHGLRCGEMIFVGGQVDLDSVGTVLHPNDIKAQTAAVMKNIATVLDGFGAALGDLVKLVVYYEREQCADEDKLFEQIAAAIGADPGPAVSAVPLEKLAYPGMVVEIKAVAMLGSDGKSLPRSAAKVDGLAPLPSGLSHGVRCGEMIFVANQTARGADGVVLHPGDLVAQSREVMERCGKVLSALGASHGDTVKINRYYQGAGTAEAWEGSALKCAEYFPEPGPAATGLPLPRMHDKDIMIAVELWAMLGADGSHLPREHVWPEGHWDWPVHLPYKHGVKCGGMIFLGGQVSMDSRAVILDPHELRAQTRASMDNLRKVLAGLDAKLDDVVEVTAFYQGDADADQLHSNLEIRSACFTEPGPTSTGVPFPALAYEGMVIEIEVIAMT